MGVRHFKVTLVTEGPVHIGDGGILNKKDYFLSKGSGERVVVVLDAACFVAKLDDEQIERYIKFLEGSSREGLQDLLARDSRMRSIADDCIAYETAAALTKRRNGKSYQYFDVATFVKDPYGCPYIPGSSLKGVIRTALLNSVLLADPKPYFEIYNHEYTRGGNGVKSGKKVERSAFWVETPDQRNPGEKRDIMHFISVSDSEPLPIETLTFAKKYDLFSKRDDASHKRDMGNLSDHAYYEGNELNLYRECLKPGTSVTFDVDVDERIDEFLPFDFALDSEGLKRVFDSSYKRYKECFLDKYEDAKAKRGANSGAFSDGQCQYVVQSGPLAGMRCRNRAVAGTGYCNTHAEHAEASATDSSGSRATYCYVGGGTDYAIKTITNALFEDDDLRLESISRILYRRFPSKADESLFSRLAQEIREAGFEPKRMSAVYDKRSGALRKGKEDHRHWRDMELGTSPHTQKLGIIGNEKLPMGKCEIRIEER